MKIILGSKSPGRRQILEEMGYDFVAMNSDIDEKTIRENDPRKLVVTLAYAKACALIPKINEAAILITVDTVVSCNNQIFEKPKDKNEARKFLQTYAKHPAEAITAVVVTNTITKKQDHGIDIATVWFNPIPKNVIEQLLDQERTLACAGGFAINSLPLKEYVAKIEGTIESIIGMPIELTNSLILKAHVTVAQLDSAVPS